ncbi:hypothetical protein HPB52_015718 [Rhipicephalus sanguineus]|uniref:H15 domain-containing protein n=1 Tax=Rhipicephalus sanguineus TaxID=34632 RepID=A0A9D4TAQ6_RHISA|nr:hypothetical protein HPB52_015718 [Rhipicephalus sanguineus]
MAKRAKEARAEDSEPSESESGSSSSSSERKQPKETQPKMIDMIIDALNNMDDRKGASPMYLKKFILGKYPEMDTPLFRAKFKRTFIKAIENNIVEEETADEPKTGGEEEDAERSSEGEKDESEPTTKGEEVKERATENEMEDSASEAEMEDLASEDNMEDPASESDDESSAITSKKGRHAEASPATSANSKTEQIKRAKIVKLREPVETAPESDSEPPQPRPKPARRGRKK